VAENSLVTQEDLADGARLIQQLDQAGFPITAAFWAFDSVLETWRFIIAAPSNAIESLLKAYGDIQRIISDDGLGITLNRISLISDNDAKLKNLQALAKSDAEDVVEVSAGHTEIAGRVLGDIHLYRNDALLYERDVIQALRRVLPSDNPSMQISEHALIPRVQADALIDDGERLVIVETKAFVRRLGTRDIMQVDGLKHAYERFFERFVVAIIVSRSGFADNAMQMAQSAHIVLVQWVGPEDDEKLQQALVEALAG
jgi:hypothetical protein